MLSNANDDSTTTISKTLILDKFKAVRETTRSLAQELVEVKNEYANSPLYSQYNDYIDNKFSEDERGLKIATRSIDLLIKKVDSMDDPIKTEDIAEIRKKFADIYKTMKIYARSAEKFFKEMVRINKSIADALGDEY
jgi:hypothetical protein